MSHLIRAFEQKIVAFGEKVHIRFASFALFLIYFWFGILKVIGGSPANPLVSNLMEATIPFMTFSQFIVAFGIYEMIIGIAFLFSRFHRLAIVLFIPHIVMTTLPLFVLPTASWQGALIPTLEGQYIIKNIALVALALTLMSRIRLKESL